MKIGELAAMSDTAASTVRFYERNGLLPAPQRQPNGYRSYQPEVADRIRFIRRAQGAGLSLRDISDVLAIRDVGQQPCDHVRTLLVERLAEVRAQLAELTELQSSLEALVDRADQPQVRKQRAQVCPILEANAH